MRRFPVVIGATVAGLAGVLGFHSRPGTRALPVGSARTAGGGANTPTNTPANTPANASVPGTTVPQGAGSAQATPTTAAPAARHAAGTAEQYGYGVLSVRVSVDGSHITNVTLAALQTADTYSTQLADQVVPILRREVLSAQSARINGISGATYTSEAYAASVQSALDRLHVR
jgi:uncharacterized protein with FMN-binding domain